MPNPPLQLIDQGFDGHVHTYLCNHAKGTMEQYVLSAIDKGIHTICFLEHLEVEIQTTQRSWLTDDNFHVYFEQGELLKEKFGRQITILLGVEAGFNPDAPDTFLQTLQKFPWDRIGLSCHFVKVGLEHQNVLSRKKESLTKLINYGPQRVAKIYYRSIVEALSLMDRCDVVCHLDAVLRHCHNNSLGNESWELIEEILETMDKKRTALELNTSGFTLRKTPYPSWEIITAAIKKGIPVQAGSDAHHPDQVGRYFFHLNDMLNEKVEI